MVSMVPRSSISLLWPTGGVDPGARTDFPPSTIADLDLDSLTDALALHTRYRDTARRVLLGVCCDEHTIGYRQDVLGDLLALPDLVVAFEELLPKLVEVGYLGGGRSRADTPLHETIWRLGELELYSECVTALEHALGKAESGLHSAGLEALLASLRQITTDEAFQALVAHLPEMQSALNGLHSLTIGVNLDHLLRPVEATLLSVSHETFTGSAFLSRLFGTPKPLEGLGPLHHIDTASLPDVSLHPFMQPLFRDLDKVIRSAVRPIADFLAGYARVSSQFLLALEQEVAFYVGAVRFITRLRDQGLPFCRPEFVPARERVGFVEGIYNVNLALRMAKQQDAVTRRRGDTEKRDPTIGAGETAKLGSPTSSMGNGAGDGRMDATDKATGMVLNDIRFGEEGRVFILTGPNSGGKTTFTQAVGLVHILHQAGLLVPGTRARLSPVDAIWTHFPMAEEYNMDAGRLGEEAHRLEAIFRRATPQSLILLNESLFSTSPGESLYLASDVVRALRYLGARAIYATHLHELANNVEEINRQTPGSSRVASLVATVESLAPEDAGAGPSGEMADVARPTYRIEPGPPMGLSYARQIAARYGISYEQLTATIGARVGKPGPQP